jgi:spore germination protein YaaH
LYLGTERPKPLLSSTPRQSFHVVAPKETLYSVAQKYQLTVNELQQMNELDGFNVGIGDTLYLDSKPPTKSITAPVGVVPATEQPKEPEEEVEDSQLPKNKNTGPVKAIKEKGIASVFPDNNTKKYLALHRNAPVGTIMQVRNEMTNLTVFVRVVGRLPNTGENTNVLLKLSQAAQQGLGALDDRFRVEISYIPAR